MPRSTHVLSRLKACTSLKASRRQKICTASSFSSGVTSSSCRRSSQPSGSGFNSKALPCST